MLCFFLDFFAKESLQVRFTRVKTLWEGGLYKAAFRLSSFLVKHLPTQPEDELDKLNVSNTISLHFLLMVKLKSTETAMRLVSRRCGTRHET